MFRIALWIIIGGFTPLAAEEIRSPSSPGYESIVQPRSQSLRGFSNYHPMYSEQSYRAPQPYSHVPYLYYGAYNYRMQRYPYMAYRGGGSQAPGYPFSRSSEQEEADRERFEGARIISAAADIDESGRTLVSSEQFNRIWVQAVGMTRMPPPISSRESAALVASPASSAPLIIDNVRKSEDTIRIRLRRDRDRGFYESDEEAQGSLSAAIFVRGDNEIEFLMPDEEASEGSEEEDEERIEHFLASGRVDMTPRSDHALTSNLRDGGYFALEVIRESKRRRLENFILPEEFEELVEELDIEQENLYILGRYFETEEQADRLSSLRIEHIEATEVGDQIKHTVRYSEDEDSDPGFRASRIEDDEIEDVVVRIEYVITEKPRDQFPGISFRQERGRRNRVDDL